MFKVTRLELPVVRVLLGVIAVASAGCPPPTVKIGEIQVRDPPPFKPGQVVVLTLPVESRDQPQFKWTALDGGEFSGSTETSSAKFKVPNQTPARVVCSVTVGGMKQERTATLKVDTQDGGGRDGVGMPEVMSKGVLANGLGMGHDDSEHRRGWVNPTPDGTAHALAYPGYPPYTWGALFVTIGEPTDTDRPGADYSRFTTLLVEMKGPQGAVVEVGVKDRTQPNRGQEYKEKVVITTNGWHTYSIPLRKFAEHGTKLKELYVVCELVFARAPVTVYLKNIRYER